MNAWIPFAAAELESEIRAEVAASALNERSEQRQCHHGRTVFQG
jgi:hypothetical protein